MRLIGYVRVSRVMGRGGASFQSPTEQRKAIEHIVALTPGAVIVDWIEELDESGGTMDRPGAQQAIRAVDGGQVDGIVMAYLSRWARTPSALQKIEEWSKNGKVFLSAAERIDTTTSHGMFALGVLLLVAKLDLDRYTETWDASTRNAIERGVAISVPYGYERGDDRRLVPVEPAASVVKDIYRRRAARHGVAAIAESLNADGVAPPRAVAWTRQTVRAMLTSRTYLGEAWYGANRTVDAHPALVDEATWNAAQTVKGVSHGHSHKNLLAGMLRCAGCGYLMGAGQGGGGRRYSCNRVHGGGRCPSPTAAMAERLETHVTTLFLERYGSVPIVSAQTSPELLALEHAHDAARREFAAWRDDTAMRRVVGDADYRAGLLARHAAVEDAERAHAVAVRAVGAQTLAIDAAMWDDLTTPERRLLMAAGIDDIVLSRAVNNRVPIADRCVIRWTGEGSPDGLPRHGVAGIVR